jgi:predicted protein tyrosine phosphatase
MPHRSRARRVLFVCALNRARSATAERLFCKRPDLEVSSAGTSADARVRVSRRMLDWADVVFTMDDSQAQDLRRQFPDHPALDRLVCLDIPDAFGFLDPRLVALLEDRVAPVLDSGG